MAAVRFLGWSDGTYATPDGFVTWHLAIRLNAVFQAVELPARITDLKDSSFTHLVKLSSQLEGRESSTLV